MSPEATTDEAKSNRDLDANARQRFGIALLIFVGLIAGLCSYLGTREAWVAPERRPDATAAGFAGAQAEPAWEIELPAGPNRDEFQTSCLICHSARLPLDQPRFKKDKWAEIVHKMVVAYGAPLTPPQEAEVVDYLVAVRSPGP